MAAAARLAPLAALAGLGLPGLSTAARWGMRPIRVGHWNLYWKALDNTAGREAVLAGIDAATHQGGSFDFFSMLEASGSSSPFPGWMQTSTTLKEDGPMKYLHGRSFHETIVLLYRAETWQPVWHRVGEFEAGRPFLLGLFKLRTSGAERRHAEPYICGDAIWVVTAHLPHASGRPRRQLKIGAVLAAALAKGSMITGCDASAMPTIIAGDFNEFGECSLPPRVQCREEGFRVAARSMLPLWEYFGSGNVADAADSTSPTCCTKWHEAMKNDWFHHYDHLYFSSMFLNVSKPATFIPYSYPGSGSCSSDACSGALRGDAPASQGSWHRGWQVTFAPQVHLGQGILV